MLVDSASACPCGADLYFLRFFANFEKNLHSIMAKEEKVWICSVCGYKFVGPKPPKECPVCHASSEYFDEVKDDTAQQ